MRRIAWLYLTVKYWFKGDSWRFAGELAFAIVYGFKGLQRKWER